MGYSPSDQKELETTEQLSLFNLGLSYFLLFPVLFVWWTDVSSFHSPRLIPSCLS